MTAVRSIWQLASRLVITEVVNANARRSVQRISVTFADERTGQSFEAVLDRMRHIVASSQLASSPWFSSLSMAGILQSALQARHDPSSYVHTLNVLVEATHQSHMMRPIRV